METKNVFTETIVSKSMTKEQFFKQSLKVMQVQASSYCSCNSWEHSGGSLKSVEQLNNKYCISEPSQIENKPFCIFLCDLFDRQMLGPVLDDA